MRTLGVGTCTYHTRCPESRPEDLWCPQRWEEGCGALPALSARGHHFLSGRDGGHEGYLRGKDEEESGATDAEVSSGKIERWQVQT